MTEHPSGGAAAGAAREPATVKPLWRGWLHAVTAPLALVAGVVLVLTAPTGAGTVASAIYLATSVLLFTTSGVYHRGHWSSRVGDTLRRLDHANVFLFIAGSYTPFAVLALHGTTRVVVLAVVWGGAAAGGLSRALWLELPRWSYLPLYLALGWTAAFVFPQLLRGAGVTAFTLLAVGGAIYTAGAVVYGLRRPNPNPRVFGFHEVFHACTIAAYICQFAGASLVVYRAG